MSGNIIDINNIRAFLMTRDRMMVNTVHRALEYEVPGARFTQKFKSGTWNGKMSFFDFKTWTFPAGLIGNVTRVLNERGFRYDVIDHRGAGKAMDCPSAEILTGKGFLKAPWVMRDYQAGAVKAAVERRNGVVVAPTGSGKTLICCGLIQLAAAAGLNVLFLTHKKELLHQTAKKVWETTGVPAGVIGDGVKEIKPISMGMVQTLALGLPFKRAAVEKYDPKKREMVVVKKAVNRKGNPILMDYLKSVDMIIIDEAHHSDSESWQLVCNWCENAFYRIGVTATAEMKGDIEDLKLQAVTGDIIYRITLQDLIDRGLLAQPYVKFMRVGAPLLPQKMPWRDAYKAGVVKNAARNRMILDETFGLVKGGAQVLILVNQINHGKALLKNIKAILPKTVFISGSDATEKRQAAVSGIESGELDVLISSTITDEGVDIPAISAVILAGGWKSPIRLYQRIGRGMRPKAGDNHVFIIDFIDLTNRHLARHSMARFKIIKDEPGFTIVSSFDSLMVAA